VISVPGEQPTAIVLIVGSALFIIGASLPPEPARVFSVPRREHLDILNRHTTRWRAMNALMIASVILTAVGLAMFAQVLRAAGDTWRSAIGAYAYAIVAVLWLLGLTFRSTATILAAREADRAGEIPPWLEPLEEWTGQMFWIYMVTAYATVSFFGWAIVRTDLVGHKIGWFGVVFSYVLGASFITRLPKVSWGSIAEVPALIHIATLVFGVALLH